MSLRRKSPKIAFFLLLFIFKTACLSMAQEAVDDQDILDYLPAFLAAAVNTDNDGDGYSENQGDCSDLDANIYPGATEICGDGIDQDCSGGDLVCTSSPAEGLYAGTTNTGRSLSGLILDDGTFYFLYSVVNQPGRLGGVVQGNATGDNIKFSSLNARDFNIEGSGVLPVTVNGTYVVKQSISGNTFYSTLNETVTFSAAYNPDYELTPSLDKISGNYSGDVLTSLGWEPASLSISSSGSISGVGQSGCTVSGSTTPRSSGNVYDVTVTFGGSPCLFANETFKGIAYFDETDNWLYTAAPNASRTGGALFSGQKSTLPPMEQCNGEVISPLNLTIGTPLNQTIEAFGTKYYVFNVVDPALYTISLYNMATDNDWVLIKYVSNCEDDYPLDPPIIAQSSNLLTTPDIKAVSLNPAKYLLIVDEWDDLPSSYTVSVTR